MNFFFDDPRKVPVDPAEVSPFKPTGFGENLGAAAEAFTRTESSISDRSALAEALSEREARIEAVTGKSFSEALSPFMAEGFDAGAPGMYAPQNLPRIEDAVAALRNSLPDGDRAKILSGPALELRSRELTQEALARTGDVMARGRGTGAAIGRFLGTLAGGVQDPLVWSTLPAGAAAGARISTTFAVEAAIAGGTTAAAQPKVQEWREKLGLPHGFQEGAENVALAAGLGGTLGAGLRALGVGISRLSKRDLVRAFDETVAEPTAEQKAARDALAREAEFDERNPFGAGRAATEEHARRTRAAETAIEDLRAPRLDEIEGDTVFDRPLADTGPEAVPEPRAPEPPRTRPTVRATSGTLYQFRAGELETDAGRFQYKEGGDDAGVTDRLKGVKQWDPARAGIAIVWEDLAGRRFVADGHQRLGLAKRIAGEDPAQDPQLNAFLYREADDFSAEDVMVIAALKNIAEGTGTPVDAAKILRARGEIEANLPPNSALVRDAAGLARLSDDAFSMVVNKLVAERHAAILGRLAADRPEIHAQALSVLRDAEPANLVEAESILRDVLEGPTVTETTADLFGTDTSTAILYKERAKVLSNAARRLKDDKRVFGLLSREEGRISEAGNILDTQANRSRAQDDAQILETLQKLARRKGPVADALARAAEALRTGARLGDVTRDFIDDVRGAADAQFGDGARSRGERRPAESGDEPGRAADAGDDELDPTQAELEAAGQAAMFGPSPVRASAPEALEAFAGDTKAGQAAQATALEADLRRTLDADPDIEIPATILREDAGGQLEIPGAGRISDAEQAQRGADRGLGPRADQRPADEGLFSDDRNQSDLIDRARPRVEPGAGRARAGDRLELPVEGGTVRASDVLRELDADRDFVEQLGLCLK